MQQGGGGGRGGEASQLHPASLLSSSMDEIGSSGLSPRLSEERWQMEGIQRAMNMSALVQELTPRSARQKSLDYAAGMGRKSAGHQGEGGGAGDDRSLSSDRVMALSSAAHRVVSNGIIRRGPAVSSGVGSSAWQRHQIQPGAAAAPAVTFVGSMVGGSSAVSPRGASAGKSPSVSSRHQTAGGSSITSLSMQVPPLQMSRIQA